MDFASQAPRHLRSVQSANLGVHRLPACFLKTAGKNTRAPLGKVAGASSSQAEKTASRDAPATLGNTLTERGLSSPRIQRSTGFSLFS